VIQGKAGQGSRDPGIQGSRDSGIQGGAGKAGRFADWANRQADRATVAPTGEFLKAVGLLGVGVLR
jgi:hypothetical protein